MCLVRPGRCASTHFAVSTLLHAQSSYIFEHESVCLLPSACLIKAMQGQLATATVLDCAGR